jgi:hypothetical protein
MPISGTEQFFTGRLRDKSAGKVESYNYRQLFSLLHQQSITLHVAVLP